jgi:hypothetical protein
LTAHTRTYVLPLSAEKRGCAIMRADWARELPHEKIGTKLLAGVLRLGMLTPAFPLATVGRIG